MIFKKKKAERIASSINLRTMTVVRIENPTQKLNTALLKYSLRIA